MTTTTRQKTKKVYPKVISGLWLLFLGGLAFGILYIYAVSINFLNLFGELPNMRALENPKSALSSELYSSDNVILGKYFRENRTPVEFEDLPENFVHALMATEDIRFEEHSGIDPEAMGRVLGSLMIGTSKGGGSTITQQLAKNLFRTRGEELNNGLLNDTPGFRTLIHKTKEWIMAVKLEQSYTKQEIMVMYLNVFEFGSNAFGIQSASKTFFNKNPKDLEVQESAVLVGLFKNPNFYSPKFNPENSKRRRNVVMSQMVKYGFMPAEEYEKLKETDIELDYRVENQNIGLAPYFRTEASKYLLKWCRENGYDLYADGLKIYTTIDSRMQASARARNPQTTTAKQPASAAVETPRPVTPVDSTVLAAGRPAAVPADTTGATAPADSLLAIAAPTADPLAYTSDADTAYYFAMVYPEEHASFKDIETRYTKYNNAYNRNLRLQVETRPYQPDQVLLLIRSFPDMKVAQTYNIKQKAPQSPIGKIRGVEFTTFVISSANLQKLLQKKDLEAYLNYFSTNN